MTVFLAWALKSLTSRTGIAIAAGFAVITLIAIHLHNDQVARGDLATMTANRDAWQRNAQGWQASFAKSEKLRRDDRQTALADAAKGRDQCEDRVAAARRSRAAIRTIIERPPTIVNGCPARETVGADELRGALQ